MIRLQKLLATAVVLSLLSVLPLLAADVRGKIASVRLDENKFVLTETFRNLTFEVNNTTRVLINDREGKLADMRPGDEAAVAYDKQGKRLIALTVRCTRTLTDRQTEAPLPRVPNDPKNDRRPLFAHGE